MTRFALLAGVGLGLSAIGPAQAYEWGGGSCIGYDCARRIHDGDYRRVRTYEFDDHRRPGVRVYERRRIERYEVDDDFDDED